MSRALATAGVERHELMVVVVGILSVDVAVQEHLGRSSRVRMVPLLGEMMLELVRGPGDFERRPETPRRR